MIYDQFESIKGETAKGRDAASKIINLNVTICCIELFPSHIDVNSFKFRSKVLFCRNYCQ